MSKFSLFGARNNGPTTPRQNLENKYISARQNLLLVVMFSAVNILFLCLGTGSYFLFSASIPYLLVDLGRFYCGMYPAEEYTGEFAGMVFADQSFFVTLLIVAIVIIALYVVCWYFSKNHKVGFLVFALVLFSIDTVALLMFATVGSIIDIAFHGWVIVILIMGISAHYKIKKLPPEAEIFPVPNENGEIDVQNSPILRVVDPCEKSRTLLEVEAEGHTILYRRVKNTNELVIDGNVYAEYTALVETPHCLSAQIDGHTFEAGLNALSKSYINVDGKTVLTKIRWI